jgi:hypothetical protein
MTAAQSRPRVTGHTETGRPGMTARIGAAGGRLSDRIHAAADDRARARGWQITHTPSRLGLSGRSYRDPRFAARRPARQGTPARTGQRYE